jgi:hypothetical protein
MKDEQDIAQLSFLEDEEFAFSFFVANPDLSQE